MDRQAWISKVTSNYRIGSKQGLRAKFYDQDWDPASTEIPLPNENVLVAHRRHKQGYTLNRREMTEAVAVWDETRFKRVGDLFAAGPFYAVKGKLEHVLRWMNRL